MLFFKRYINNLFLDLKKQIYNILDTDNRYDLHIYIRGFEEIIKLLSKTLVKIEDIYYKHFLLPTLQKIKQSDHIID